MNDLIYRVLAIVAGITLAVQPPVNARLRSALGDPVWASFVSFIVGAIALALIAAVMRAPFPNVGTAIRETPWWIWMGGLCGVAYVTLALVVVPRIGSAGLLSLAILGMLLGAIVIDNFGFFGLPVQRVTLVRLAGAGFVVAGAFLVARP